MMATEVQSNSTQASTAAATADSDVLTKIQHIGRSECPHSQFYRAAFRLVAQHFNAGCAFLSARLGGESIEDDYLGRDRAPEDIAAFVDAMVTEAESDERSSVRIFAKGRGQNIAILSAPIYATGSQIGSMALATVIRSNKDARQLLSELTALLAFIAVQREPGETKPSCDRQTADVNRTLHRAISYASATELAYSIVNGVASKFDCEQVSFGMLQRRQIRILAVSGLDRFSAAAHGVVAIQQAMEECADSRETINYQLEGGFGESSGEQSFLLHRQLHKSTNHSSILSVPLLTEGTPIGVVCLQRASERPFSKGEIAKIRGMIEPFAPATMLLQKSSRSLVQHCIDSLHGGANELLQPGRWGRRVGTATLACGLLFFLFGFLPQRIVVPCRIQPAVMNHVVAPFEGTLKEVFIRDGSLLQEGELIAQFDSEPLELEHDRLRATMASFRIDMDRALSDRNVAEAAIASAGLQAAAMQIRIIEARIDQATIRAPMDGIVLRGALNERLGQVMSYGDPLVEMGTTDRMRIQIDIPDSQAHFVTRGDTGRFASHARPDHLFTFELKRMSPSAQVVNDRNVFTGEADLEQVPEWIRAGMEGTAKINVGWKPTWWVMTHGALDRVRMWMWL